MNIRVAGLTFSVEPDNERMFEGGMWGETSHNSQAISYTTLVPKERQQQSVLHELIHAVIEAYGPRDDRSDEAIAKALSGGLYQVLTDSPELRKFLFEGK